MAYELSAKTARKLKAVINKGQSTGDFRPESRGTGRYDTHVRVTGPIEFDGYPCVVTWYDPVDSVWDEFEGINYVIDANDQELCVDKRYRALCYGKNIYSDLVFVTDIKTESCPYTDDSDSDSDSDSGVCVEVLTDVNVYCSGNEIVTDKTFTTICFYKNGNVTIV